MFTSQPRNAPRDRIAHVYRRADKYFVCASSKTRDGFWLEDGPAVVLPVGNAAALDDAIRAALARSRSCIPAPKDWTAWRSSVLEVARYKRFSAFAKGTALVSIEQGSNGLRAIPHRNGGSKEGYVGLVEQCVALGLDARSLSKLTETAFERCC
jgi:hypothetical protein